MFFSTHCEPFIDRKFEFYENRMAQMGEFGPHRGFEHMELATHVAREGTLRFLRAHPQLNHWVPKYLARDAAARAQEAFLLRLRKDLRRLYASSLSAEEKLRQF